MEKIEESEVKIIRAATPKISEEDVFEEEKIEYIQPRIIPFEEEYFDVMNNPNKIWAKYEEKMVRVVNKLAYWKNFDKEELIQQSYIYFVNFCKIYDPYYGGGFIPFDKYLFKNMIIKLRAYIQRYYFKHKREQPTEFSEYTSGFSDKISNDIDAAEEKIYNEYVYSLISDRQQHIIDLSLQGYKQQEIGDILDISQSRVSVIKKKTLARLNEILNNNGVEEKHRKDF